MAFALSQPLFAKKGLLRLEAQAHPDVHRPCRSTASHIVATVAAAATSPLQSLDSGKWFKLICGASSHDAPMVRNLSLAYALAGADCVDVAADGAVVHAARSGLAAAAAVCDEMHSPLLMVSISDGPDPHFRKAEFDPAHCPPDCTRPCERVCPADAISTDGVHFDRCYGCGRCVPACPLGLVVARDERRDVAYMRALLDTGGVDAVEIHTSARSDNLAALWRQIGDVAVRHLQLVAVSFPDPGDDQHLHDYLASTWRTLRDGGWDSSHPLIWQTDGRPMSGDVGAGTAKSAVKLAARTVDALRILSIPGHVQLAGGTNQATGPLLVDHGLMRRPGSDERTSVSGVAMGGYARKVLVGELEELQVAGLSRLEDDSVLLARSVARAKKVVDLIKDAT